MSDTEQLESAEDTEGTESSPARRWLMPAVIAAAVILALGFAFALPRGWVMVPEELEQTARDDGAEAEKNPKEFYA